MTHTAILFSIRAGRTSVRELTKSKGIQVEKNVSQTLCIHHRITHFVQFHEHFVSFVLFVFYTSKCLCHMLTFGHHK